MKAVGTPRAEKRVTYTMQITLNHSCMYIHSNKAVLQAVLMCGEGVLDQN